MSYDTHVLEFHIELHHLSSFAQGQSAKDALLNLPILNEEQAINSLWDQLDLMQHMHHVQGQLPITNHYEIKPIVTLISKGHIADTEEMRHVKRLVDLSEDLHTYHQELKTHVQVETFFDAFNLPKLKALHQSLQHVFDDQENIKDDASTELKSIRKKLSLIDQRYQQSLQQALRSYEAFLNDFVIVAKNDALCLSVSDTYKNKVKGIVMDTSQSKQTVYIEPHQSSLIRLEKSQLLQDEKKEIYNILFQLTQEVTIHIESIELLINMIQIYDMYQAKSRYAMSMNAVRPNISHDKIDLIQARHPQLKKDAVPIDISISRDAQGLFITGPNTGGKTVSLKTVGLLQLMAQSGLFIPVSESTSIMIFEHIFADIGDDQSIAHNLSTFSSHLVKHVNYIKKVNRQSLLLIDEIGTGTDPQEGVALAKSILQTYLNKGAMMIVTTHFQVLKEYALKHQLNLASVAFDENTLSPQYHIIPGISGQSHAFDIAKRLGLPNDVLTQAKDMYHTSQSDTEKLLLELEKKEFELKDYAVSLNSLNHQLQDEKNALNERLIAFEVEKKHAINQAIKEETQKLQKKISDVEAMLQTLKTNPQTLPITSKIKGQIHAIQKEKEIKQVSFQVGESVYIDSYGQIGTILSIKQNSYKVRLGQFELKFSKDELTKTSEKPAVKKHTKEIYVSKPKSDYIYELDLRGFRFEEVKPALEKAIDQAVMSNQETLSVIHGFGTGAVKNAVHQYIKNHPNIKSHRYGKEGEGLNGVTILTLK